MHDCKVGSCGDDDNDTGGDEPLIDTLELDEHQVISSLPPELVDTPPEPAPTAHVHSTTPPDSGQSTEVASYTQTCKNKTTFGINTG